MIPFTLAQVAEVTGGAVVPAHRAQVRITGPVVTDSRQAAPGALYVARVGEHADGHEFASGAAQLGAVAALTTRPLDSLPCVVVEDTERAFGALARAVVEAMPHCTLVGITGSSGKTSTKDLLGQVLATAGETIAAEGSFNSEIGVPLTVCRASEGTRFLVVEMGARGIGHVAYLAGIAPPEIGVVLNVGVAHVGEFGSVEAIAIAKRELVEALPAHGLAVLNADDPVVAAMARHTKARVVLVGEANGADIHATDVELTVRGAARFTVTAGGVERRLTLAGVGRHHVGNALAVIAVALECGMHLAAACQALEAAAPVSRWRMEVTERRDGVSVVNDAYNANPDSVRAALDVLAHLGVGRRSWAVLGAMLELGADSDTLHAEVGSYAVTRGIDELVVVGDAARPIAHGARAVEGATKVRCVQDADAAEELLRAELRRGDVVLFKSSRDAGLRWLGDRVAEEEVLP